MDQISTSNNNEVNYEIGPPFSYLLNPSDSESKFSNAVDDGDGGVSENEKKKFAGKSSDNLIDTEHRSSIGRNDVSSLSWTKNEVIANDSLVVEKNPHNALEDIEKVDTNADFLLKQIKVTDDVLKKQKQNVCDGYNEDTNLTNDKTLNSNCPDNFVPTIAEILGGCSDVPEQADSNPTIPLHDDVCSSAPSKIPSLNLANVLSGSKDVNSETNIESNSASTSSHIVHSISDYKDVAVLNKGSPNSSQTEKCVAKKRLTRSALSESNDRIILSSSFNMDNVLNSMKPNQLPKNAPYSSGAYSCHLCNTVFQEHELLNEHMILHRNNCLVEANVQNRSKTAKVELYSCDSKKQLSTSHLLQQHVLIHKNVKPFACHICQKKLRHLSDYRMHLQKHKAEQRHREEIKRTGSPEQLDKSVVRGVDFGRLVGPLFMKESLLHNKLDTISSTSRSLPNINSPSINLVEETTINPSFSIKQSPCQLHLSFDRPRFETKENTTSSAVIIRKQVSSADSVSEEECVAVKSFNNIESVVMNASKFIVKLDNLDTSALKRKLRTPDISIDQPSKKCRVSLLPIAEKCNIKLDEIENIPMDIYPCKMDTPTMEQSKDDYLNEDNGVKTAGSSCSSYLPHETLSDSELFTLLNDNRDISTATIVSVDSAGDGGSSYNCHILQPESSKVDATKTTISSGIKQSDVIFVETPLSCEMSHNEDEAAFVDNSDDVFDAAFLKVATRRLALLQKRAAKNDGKVENRYLLGPLFWYKALRRAKARTSAVATGNSGYTNNDFVCDNSNHSSYSGDPAKTWAKSWQHGGRSRFDDRRTNDPVKLQSRAENKFKCLLERAKMMNNLNAINLTGPRFWQRTLQLAGVHRGEDLRIHTNVVTPTLEGVEFVGDDGTSCDFGSELVNIKTLKMPQFSPLDPVPIVSTSIFKSNNQRCNDRLPSDTNATTIDSDIIVDDVLQLPDQISASLTSVEQRLPVTDDTIAKIAFNDVTFSKTDDILFESLTKPTKNQHQQSIKPDKLPPSTVFSGSAFIANPDNVAESRNGTTKFDINDDGCDSSQLIPFNKDPVAITKTGQNFVLMSDGNGTMQYMVHVANENYANFKFIGDDGGDQIAYAIQFDSENYTGVQFVQDSDGIQLQSDSSLKIASPVDPKTATYLLSKADAAATAVVTDANHIGKELSDFLNLDYGNFLKNGTAGQHLS